MRKRLCVLVAAVSALLVCAVGFSPTPAFAADSDSVYVDGVELTGSSTTPAYATTDTSGAVTTGGSEDAYNIKWDGTTLTLNNATIDYQENAGDNTKGAIMFDGDLAIELKGDNRITSVTSGISCNGAGELTIRGDQLTIESAYYGIEGVDDTGRAITVSGAKLTIEVDTMPRFTAAGIQAAGLLSIADGAVLDITGATDEAAALIGNGGISIVGSTVSARIAAAGAYGMGVILSNGDVVIDGSMVEVSTSETVLNYALVSMANSPYTGGDIVIKNGSAVQANSTSGMAFHTSSGDIEIADSTVEATGGYMAVYAMGNLTIRGTADVTAQGPGPALFATGDCVLDPEEQLVDVWTGASVDDATKFAGSPVSTETELNALDEYFHSAPHVHAFVEHVEDDAYLESAATCTEPAAYYLSCECGEAGTDTFTVGAPLGHDWGDWEVVTPADCTDSGIEERVCASCQNKESREIPATGHSWGEPVWTWSEDMTEASATFTCSNNPSHTEVLTAEPTASVKAEPTCTESGQRVYSAAVELGGKKYDVTSTAEIPATGHDWGEPAWSWDDGYTKFVATFTCSNDPSHTEVLTAEPTASVKAEPTASVKAEPTCTEAGVRVYTATVELDGTKCTATSEQAIPALGHDFRDGVCTVCEAKDPDYVAPEVDEPTLPATGDAGAFFSLVPALAGASALTAGIIARRRR